MIDLSNLDRNTQRAIWLGMMRGLLDIFLEEYPDAPLSPYVRARLQEYDDFWGMT